jgi:hypothetical protein
MSRTTAPVVEAMAPAVAPAGTTIPAATLEYLRKAGVDTQALAEPPQISELKPELGRTHRFVGNVDEGQFQYMRATAQNPQELKNLIERDGYVVAPGVELEGVKGPEDVILRRRRDTAVQLEQRRKNERDSLRRRQQRRAAPLGSGEVPMDYSTQERGTVMRGPQDF